MNFTTKTVRPPVGTTKAARIMAVSCTALLAACIPQSDVGKGDAVPGRVAIDSAPFEATPVAAYIPPPPPAPPPAPAVPGPVLSAQRILDSRIQSLARAFNGDIGIAVKDVQTGWVSEFDGRTLFPQQSVSKFWVALTALDKVDRGELNLQRRVTLGRDDLTLFHQPIREQINKGSYSTTLADLLNRAITQSDNTANDFLMWSAGGPEAVRSFLKDKDIDGIRFGPGERLLQTRIAGMEWKPHYSIGRNFYTARANVPSDVRRAAFERYIADPMDGATPVGIVEALSRLKKGELLSPQSTQLLLRTMSNTRTGPRRLKGGLAPGWTLAHKTGTGQVFGGAQAGYNDIGIVTAPDGRSYAVAVMIRRSSAPIPERMGVMQNTVRAVISYVQNMQGYDMAENRTGYAATRDEVLADSGEGE